MKLSRRKFIVLSGFCVLSKPALGTSFLGNGSRYIKLELLPIKEALLPANNPLVNTWSFDKDILRLKQDEPVTIEVENRLSEPTSVHWHGLRIDNDMDGVSGLTQEPIQPGKSFAYQFTPKDAGTFWAHSHHNTYMQLAKGLYMPVIVEERKPYQVDGEFTLALDDWRIDEAGQIHTQSFGSMHDWAHGGRLGNVLTVNRQSLPTFTVASGARVRLRLINTSNARVLQIKLPNLPARLIAKDGQPLPVLLPLNQSLILAPAERYDVLVDMSNALDSRLPIVVEAGNQNIDVAYLHVKSSLSKIVQSHEPIPLLSNHLPRIKGINPDHQLTLDMSGGAMGQLNDAVYRGKVLSRNELISKQQVWTFNGAANMPEKPLVEAKSGELVEIELQNNTQWPHSMHLHGHHFQADSSRYEPEMWHDTILMAPGEKVKIRFLADNPGDWLLHCHMIEHQAAGMVTWFRVT